MATLPAGYPGAFSGQDKEDRQVSLREQVWEMWLFRSVVWHCLDGIKSNCHHQQNNTQLFTGQMGDGWPDVKLSVGLLVVTVWLELCTTYSSSCHPSRPSSLAPIKSILGTFWYWFIQVVWKMAVKWMVLVVVIDVLCTSVAILLNFYA